MNEKEAAEYVGFSTSYLKKARAEPRNYDAPKFVKINGWTVRYRRSDLDEWIASLGKKVEERESNDGN